MSSISELVVHGNGDEVGVEVSWGGEAGGRFGEAGGETGEGGGVAGDDGGWGRKGGVSGAA